LFTLDYLNVSWRKNKYGPKSNASNNRMMKKGFAAVKNNNNNKKKG
jgi:hypothetical protein